MNSQVKETIMQGLLMAAAVAVALPLPQVAFAASDLAGSVSTVNTGISSIPNIVAGAFYIGGAVMIGAGAMKLKEASEKPGQVTIGAGLGRCAAGAALVALPGFAGWLQNSLGTNGSAVQFQSLGKAGS